MHSRTTRRGSRPLAAVALAAVLAAGGCAVRVGTGTAGSTATSAPVAPPSASGTVVIPLQVVQQDGATLAVVPVTIGGQGPYPFILDTGASTSGINSALSDQLGLQETGRTSQVSGVSATQQVPLVDVPEWSVGGASDGGTVALRPTAIGALDFPMQQGSGGEIAGLLGSDQLSRFGSITLDYAHQQLRFTPGAG